MTVPRRPLVRRPFAIAALALCVTLACVDGVRPRTAPYDYGDIEIEIVAIKDTVRVVGDWALFYLRSDQIHSDYPVQWSTSAPDLITAVGGGLFRLKALPQVTTHVTVRVSWGSRFEIATLVIDP